MPEMTPLEAAEKLEIVKEMSFPSYAKLIQPAIDYLREIANGEYKQVVHGRWRKVSDDLLDVGDAFFCSECDEPQERMSKFCPSCGALMESREGNSHNGKEETHE